VTVTPLRITVLLPVVIASWSARAISAAQNGAAALVPPTPKNPRADPKAGC